MRIVPPGLAFFIIYYSLKQSMNYIVVWFFNCSTFLKSVSGVLNYRSLPIPFLLKLFRVNVSYCLKVIVAPCLPALFWFYYTSYSCKGLIECSSSCNCSTVMCFPGDHSQAFFQFAWGNFFGCMKSELHTQKRVQMVEE